MKGYKLIMLLLLCAPKLLKAQDKGIVFQEAKNWNDILIKAKKENKYVFVDAFTTWCGPCKMMDMNVYSEESIGKFMNDKFISVKIQMDQTETDNDYTKSWYKDAETLKQSAHIEAYPSLLFYSPDGTLVFKSIGYKDINAFTNISKFASSEDGNNQIKKEISAYQNGIKDYSKMVSLFRTVRDIIGDNKLASDIAKDYKKNYLDKLTFNNLIRRDNLEFIKENGTELLSINDNFFKACYFAPSKVDSLLGNGSANYYVNKIVSIDVVNRSLYKNEKPVSLNPDWDDMTRFIRVKFPKVEAKALILNSKVEFYKKIGDWNKYTLFRSDQIKVNPPKAVGMDVFFALNAPAWEVFQHSEDKMALERALQWSILSIKLENANNISGALVQYYDTKANLLYKLGRVNEAIVVETKAIEMDEKNVKYSTEFRENVEKMKKGIPTW